LETATNLAQQHDSTVTVVDTVRAPSRSSLFFSTNAEDIFKMIVADKQKRLDKTAERFLDLGVKAESKLLHGKSSEAITREALEQEADLVIRYKKGSQSRYPGLFGNTARNLMRICPAPLLFVGETPLKNPKVMACVNAEHVDAENSAIFSNTEKMGCVAENLSALYCWSVPGQQYMKHYLSEQAFQETLDESTAVYRKLFEQLKEKHATPIFGDRVFFEYGEPVDVIPEFCQKENIDIVVMSSASQTHPVKRLLGSTIESVIDKIPCSLLVVKQSDFVCPVKLETSKS
ncbi:MAG: universal stress protein, partial [Pirellulaceae bacterium]|nr:universal stress protein [Pirellulaceae bacterium]